MSPLDYEVFDVKIRRSGSSYLVDASNTPAGDAEHTFKLSSEDRTFLDAAMKTLEDAIASGTRARRAGTQPSSPPTTANIRTLPEQVGRRLASLAFGGDVGECLRTSLALVRSSRRTEQGGLRIRLRMSHVDELAKYPWEYLCGNDKRFLALSTQTPIVRYQDQLREVLRIRVESTVRILVMVSGPNDQNELNSDREWTLLRDALEEQVAGGLVDIVRLEAANLDTLRQMLMRDEFHVFHYIGHGGIVNDTPVLVLENEFGMSDCVSVQQLATILDDHASLRLVILNACEGAAAPSAGGRSIAQTLNMHGIPAVVGMQFAISDRAAIKFCQQFYDGISLGKPIDYAITEARKAIHGDGNNLEWGVPVLYLRSLDGRLFDIDRTVRPKPKSPQPKPQSEGRLHMDEPYIVRESEVAASEAIRQSGKLIIIKGPLREGKSTLLQRLAQEARTAGKLVVHVKFGRFDKDTLNNSDAFYRRLVTEISQALEVDVTIPPMPSFSTSNHITAFSNFLGSVLQNASARIVLAMDDVDRFYNASYSTDFFGMIRTWWEERAVAAASAPMSWGKLDVAFCTTYQEYELVDFGSWLNVDCHICELRDFTLDEVADMNRQYGSLVAESEVRNIHDMLSGHPMLTTHAFRLIRSDILSRTGLQDHATYLALEEFRRFLEFVEDRVEENPALAQSLRDVLAQSRRIDRVSLRRLKGLGLITEINNIVAFRSKLYRYYFKEKLNV